MKSQHKGVSLERVTYTPDKCTTVTELTQGTEISAPIEQTESVKRIREPNPQQLNQTKTAPALTQGTMSTYVRRSISVSLSKQIDEQLLRVIVKAYYPFSIVEDKEFKKLIFLLCPAYSMPTRKTVSNSLIPRLYNETKEKVVKTLSSVDAACLTTDGWTSITQQSYVAITAHFIREVDDISTLQSCLLGCIPYDSSHTAQNLGMFIAEEVKKWGLQNKVICVVTDNAPNIVAAVRNNNWRHIPCFAHSLNLVLGDGMKIIHAELSKIKDIVAYFKRSSKALAKLSVMQNQLNLPAIKLKQDCVTRWNSTYDMLSCILKVRAAVIAVLAVENPELNCLSPSDWAMLEKAASVLEIFKLITEEISAEKNVTLSKLMLMIKAINKHLIKASAEYVNDVKVTKLVQELQNSMSVRFCEMDTQELITQATFLDPRFKKFGFTDAVKYERCVNFLKRKILTTPYLCSNIQDPQPSTSLQPPPSSLLWEDFDNQVEYILSNPDPHAASEQADNKLRENLALNSTEIDNLPKEMPDINNFLININQIDLESADRMKNQKENMNPNSAVTEEESLIKMTNSGNIAVNYESKLKSSVCSDTIENLFSKSSSFIENSPQCTTNDIFNLSQYIKTQWTDTSDNELILNRDILTRRPIQEKRVSSSSCNSSSSSRSSSSSSSSSNSSPCSSSNAQNVNSNVITCHINADGASTSQLATRSLRGRAILKSNYCVSPINAAESDPDLSDNDPTFQDPNEISTRLRSLSSSSTDSTSQPVTTPQHEIQQPETSNVNEPNTTQRISRKRQRNPASWKQNIKYVDPFIDHCYIQKIKHMDHTYSQSMDSSFQSNLNILEDIQMPMIPSTSETVEMMEVDTQQILREGRDLFI
ncbi:unnamed protein product [Parnassius apollo]|uniref:(apollo) hypothetical protein n=1 Tax=Parnassius apollo TaxID=110799 RepID=A0A8S3X504_PARAO|nr:unnamed protein product [Parnassius apollo]